MSFMQFLSILRARWKIAALVLLLTVGMTVAVSLVSPKRYTASASIVLDIKPDPVNGIMITGMQAPSYVATQVDILSSERVAHRVVEQLKLADRQEVRDAWMEATAGEGSIQSWIAGGLRQKLTVKPSRESNVITVQFEGGDPKTAATVANAFVQAYMDTSLDLRVAPAREYTSFFDSRAKELRDALEKAQTKLSAFQRDKGILVSDDRIDVEQSRLNELSAQIVAMQALSAESLSRQAQVGRSGDQMAEVLNNSLVSGLKAEAARLQARLSELESRLGDRHPQVIEARANLAETRSRIAAETQRVAGSVGVNNQIARQREAEIRAAFEQQRQKLLRMRETRDELAVLQRDVENAQKNYDSVLGRLQQTSLESQTTRTNVGVLNPALEPLQPSSPKIVLNTALATVLGTLLALGAVLLMELLDRRVRRPEDVVQMLDLPVIGTMPKPLRAGATRTQAIPKRVLARLPQPRGA